MRGCKRNIMELKDHSLIIIICYDERKYVKYGLVIIMDKSSREQLVIQKIT